MNCADEVVDRARGPLARDIGAADRGGSPDRFRLHDKGCTVIGHSPVLRDGTPVGIASRHDLPRFIVSPEAAS